jgi:4-hydroxy-tetrahydrodipicolinate synthase
MIAAARPAGALLTAMATAFDPGGALDAAESARIARFLIDEGNDGVVVCGTTGEAPALDLAEKLELFATVASALRGRGSVVAGVGSNNTKATVELAREARACGADALLVVVPYYSKPTQDGMLRHFGAVAEATDLPLIVYNIPGRTGANMLPATLLELARRYPQVIGVKESSGDLAQITAICRDRAPGFAVWSGDDYLFLPALSVGADGLISVAAHVCGRELREILDAYRAGDVGRAAELNASVSLLVGALFATTSPIPLKYALRAMGFAAGECRSPLGYLPESLARELDPLIAPYAQRARSLAAAP